MNKPNILVRRWAAGGDILLTSPIIKKIYEDRKGNCSIDFCGLEHYLIYVQHNPYLRKLVPLTMRNSMPSYVDYSEYSIVYNLDGVYESNPDMHIIDAYGHCVFGHTNFDKQIELYTTTNEVNFALEFSNINKKYIVVHARKGNWESRNIPLNFWQKIVNYILENTDYSVVQVGDVIEPLIIQHDRFIDMRSKISILQVKELINKSSLFIGSDSGPTHVAATTNAPIIAFYTSVKYDYRKPFRKTGVYIPFAANIECYGCKEKMPKGASHYCLRGDNECVNRFEYSSVVNSIMSVIGD